MPKRRAEDAVHVVMTDHYIQRRKPAGNLLARVEPTFDAVAPHQTVDDDLDGVVLVARQLLGALQELGDVDHFAIDASTEHTRGVRTSVPLQYRSHEKSRSKGKKA